MVTRPQILFRLSRDRRRYNRLLTEVVISIYRLQIFLVKRVVFFRAWKMGVPSPLPYFYCFDCRLSFGSRRIISHLLVSMPDSRYLIGAKRIQ
jgi:hypothetical protein